MRQLSDIVQLGCKDGARRGAGHATEGLPQWGEVTRSQVLGLKVAKEPWLMVTLWTTSGPKGILLAILSLSARNSSLCPTGHLVTVSSGRREFSVFMSFSSLDINLEQTARKIRKTEFFMTSLWAGLSLPLFGISEPNADVYQKANQDFRFCPSITLYHLPFSKYFSQLFGWPLFSFLEQVDLGRSPLPQHHPCCVFKC